MTMADAEGASHAVLALTMGEPAGIGPDITLQAWSQRNHAGLSPFVVYADVSVLEDRARALSWPGRLIEVATPGDAIAVFQSALPVIAVPSPVKVEAQHPTAASAIAVTGAIDAAVAAVARGDAAAVVTNPIAKSVLQSAGFPHPGHTEYLAELAGRFWPAPAEGFRAVMMLASDALRVVPLTIHVPLVQVAGLIRKDLIVETVRIMDRALKTEFAYQTPRIAVSGLNPHAGEDGTIGLEERDIIIPAIDHLRRDGINVTGPFSADTLFHDAARTTYDAVLAMYHDQALIPIKTLSFDTGVNVTLGLPFVRTSPDHGTAFAIAGTGAASPSSLIAALRLASKMAERRRADVTVANTRGDAGAFS